MYNFIKNRTTQFSSYEWLVLAAIIVLPFIWEMLYLIELRLSINTLGTDVTRVWRPVAQAILDGTPPYTPPAVDNKPPLWTAQQVIAEYTGHYVMVELLLMAIANLTIATGIWKIGTELRSAKIGQIAAFLYVLTIPVVNLSRISDATMGAALLVLALGLRSPYRIGAITGGAVLTSPWAIFGIPVIVVYRFWQDWTSFAQFVVAGVSLGVMSVSILWAGWGIESAIGAIQWSIGLGDSYWTGGNNSLLRRSIFYSPLGWFIINGHYARQYAVVLIPAVFGILYTRLTNRKIWVLFSLVIPLLFKPHWEFVFPVACLLSAIGWEQVSNTEY